MLHQLDRLRQLRAAIDQAIEALARVEPALAAWSSSEHAAAAPTEPVERADATSAPGAAAPNGAGLIEVSCPNCGTSFTKRPGSKQIWCGKT